MRSIVKISSKNQITLPAWMLRELGVGKGWKLELSLDKKKIVAKPRESVVNKLAGGLNKYIDPKLLKVNIEEKLEEARMERVRRIMGNE